MKTFEDRFLTDEGNELFNGNELLLKGAFETPGGVHLMTGYPGSPIASFFDSMGKLRDLIKDKGICCKLANNEAIGAAMVNGSQMKPLRTLCAFKSVGGHVAADALALGNLAGAHPDGGAVIVFGDDPWSESTQVPADSRYLCQHLHMPVLEPSTLQEVKDFVPMGFRLSNASGLYVGYILTTTLADGGSNVKVEKNHWPENSINNPSALKTDELDIENTVLLPPRTGRKERELPLRYAAIIKEAREAGVNRIVTSNSQNKIGFVASGAGYEYLMSSLDELNLTDQFPVLKMGLTFPLDDKLITDFAADLEHLVVVEERRNFLESQIAQAITHAKQNEPGKQFASLWGKMFPKNSAGFPSAMGLHPSMVLEKVAEFIKLADQTLYAEHANQIATKLTTIEQTSTGDIDGIVPRTPAFCPGCPHRDSASALLEIREQFMDAEYMLKHHNAKPTDLLFHGDTGCYTLLLFPPNEKLMHDYSGMGLGGGTGAGIDPFITNKQVVFLGDSTFFHSGMLAISNAIKQRQDITYIILDNRTTAMTGHQPTAGLDIDVLGDLTPRQDIDEIIRAIISAGDCKLVRSDPSDRKKYKKLLEKTILQDGVKVIVADKECGIVSNRRKLKEQRAELRKRGFIARQSFMNITPEICEYCLKCVEATACPGLNIEQTLYGPKTITDLSWCVNDGACANINACPSFEQVIVLRNKPPRPRGHQIKLEKLPEPKMRFTSDTWRVHTAGVGGMGIGLASSILARAGDHAGYKVIFADKKGMAIRNGGVYAQITFFKDDTHHSQTMPYGSADLIIGLDILEAARAIDPKGTFRVASQDKTTAVLNIDKTPTILNLLNRHDFDPADLQKIIQSKTRSDGFFAHNITAICERLFGTKLYANITMIGLAYQQGLIPVSLESLEWAISESVKVDFKKNMRAFNLGRKLAAHPDLFAESPADKTIAKIVREKSHIFERTTANGVNKARKYKYILSTTLRTCRDLDKATMRHIAIRTYDLINYQSFAYAKRYLNYIKKIYAQDKADHDFAVTKSVVENLFKLMLIKDEFWVAKILTSYEKARRDAHRYNINPANGDKIMYKRVFHPRFFGKMVNLPLPNWSMRVMKRFSPLRPWIPFYHSDDREFQKWYRAMIGNFEYDTPQEYQNFLAAIKSVDQVKGWGEYRTPTMLKAKSEAAAILDKKTREMASA